MGMATGGEGEKTFLVAKKKGDYPMHSKYKDFHLGVQTARGRRRKFNFAVCHKRHA